MQYFSSLRNRERAKWLLVIFLGLAVIHATHHFQTLSDFRQLMALINLKNIPFCLKADAGFSYF